MHWYPWGDEALAEARSSDRPILLSVGYSACHWCHVMEHESFSDPATAAWMNDHFVNVKVDREERPDVDAVYMRAVQAMTGRGGWPMTCFLTPDGRPFFGGTYFPPEPRHGLASFRQTLEGVHDAWTNRRPAIEKAASELGEILRRSNGGDDSNIPTGAPHPSEAPRDAGIDEAIARLLQSVDPAHGGLGAAPKFPQPVVWDAILARAVTTGDPAPMEALVLTLREMARGGMRDHVGGAFHRYSVDAVWLVPHFEKMLYDNGLLLRLYVNAFQATGVAEFAEVARAIADDLLATFRLSGGAFAAAWDADSEGVEGKFYLWSSGEVDDVLGPETGPRFRRLYDITPEGNFEGLGIPHPVESLEAAAAREGMDADALREEMATARRSLHAARASRVPPLRDEKVVTSWNAMTVRSLAEAGRVLAEPRWLEAAVDAASYLLEHHRRGDGLLRTTMEGAGSIPAFLEDWAALGNALQTLHEATLEPRWLEGALDCAGEMVSRFRDPATGLFFDAEGSGGLPVRPRDTTDSATPSGNALAVELLLRLSTLTGAAEQRRMARSILDRCREDAVRFPAGYGRMLLQMQRAAALPFEILITGHPDDPATQSLLNEAWRDHRPWRALAGHIGGGPLEGTPLVQGREPTADDPPRAWVCRGFTCTAPVTTPDGLRSALGAAPASS